MAASFLRLLQRQLNERVGPVLSVEVAAGRDDVFGPTTLPEGAPLTNAVCDLVGDGVLMYASDYPHGESHFPRSVETVLGWNMTEARKRTLFWDNAVRFYARSGLS